MATDKVIKAKTPVYFVSHGGPNIMDDFDHPVWSQLERLGTEIKQTVRPKAVIAISAHWESSTPNTIQINTAEKTDLIYDFYGFPKHYYEHEFPNIGSPSLAAKIADLLKEAGIQSTATKRGLDHGIFACFSVLFPPGSKNALFPDIPIVQISLPYTSRSASPKLAAESAAACVALGKALAPLREEGVVIINSGMAVHNLRDLFTAPDRNKPLAYAKSFDQALKEAVVGNGKSGEGRAERMMSLLERSDVKKAHPSWEHLWSVFVAAGAAGEKEKAERIWTMCEASFSWGMFRFGNAVKWEGQGRS